MSSANGEAQRLLDDKRLPDYYEPHISRECTISPEHQHALWWQASRLLGAVAGGLFYILGTTCYCWPHSNLANFLGALFYIIGSSGFLTSEILEIITTLNRYLRINLLLSITGSVAYVIGSVGYLPSIDNSGDVGIGEYGFIIGSVWVVASQTWKIRRSLRSRKEEDFWQESRDLQTIVVKDVCFLCGGVFFFVGTVFYAVGPVNGQNTWWYFVIFTWMAGSIFFLVAALLLGYRQFYLHLI